MSQSLIDRIIEVGSKLLSVDAHVCGRQRRYVFPADECAAAGSERSKLGSGFAVAGNHKSFARHHGLDYLRVLIAQLTLRDRPAHGAVQQDVRHRATPEEGSPMSSRAVPDGRSDAEGDLRGGGCPAGQGGSACGAADLVDDLVSDLVG